MDEYDIAWQKLSILNYAPVGILVLRNDYSVLFWNSCMENWTGVKGSEITGRNISNFYPHLSQPKYTYRIDTIFKGGPPAIFSSQLHSHLFPSPILENRYRIQHTKVTALPAFDGNGFYALFSVEDVTELTKRIEEYRATRDKLKKEIIEREKAEKDREKLFKKIIQKQRIESMGVMAGGLAHVFNNILMSVMGYAELAKLNSANETSVLKQVERIEKRIKEAADLCMQLLTYSGKIEYTKKQIAINQLVSDIKHLFTVVISKNVKIELELSENVPEIEGDYEKLSQALMNLLTNALEAIGKNNGLITVSTGISTISEEEIRINWPEHVFESSRFIYIQVKDNGVGMDKDTVKRIFDPFFSTKFTGRGLGMAAVYGIVKSYGGLVDIKSKPGVGSTITILIPFSLDLLTNMPLS